MSMCVALMLLLSASMAVSAVSFGRLDRVSDHELAEALIFNCPTLASPNASATSVHRLRAGDIKVIMSMGDSITAGFGMMGKHGDISKDLLEYRGQSWSIGVDAEAQTLATFFANYHSRQVGGSVGQHEVELCWGNLCPSKQRPELDVLNSAMSGAMMYDFAHGPGNQVQYLLTQLAMKREIIDMDNDWKLMTVLIGANDMCVECEEIDLEPTSPDDFEKYFREAMEALKAKVPRLLVNVGLMFNVSQIYKLSQTVPACKLIHRLLPIECMCAFKGGEDGDKHRRIMDQTAVEYNKRLEKVAAEFQAEPSDSFAIVTQPAMRDGELSHFPISFISTLDCFHPSLPAHQMMAKVMWNGIWTPRANKTTDFDFTAPFVCPTEHSIIPTG